MTFEISEETIVLICRSSLKSDQGRYAVNLKNQKGSATAHVVVTVIDKPGAPEGPLQVSKITTESCQLAWNQPKVREFFKVFLLIKF